MAGHHHHQYNTDSQEPNQRRHTSHHHNANHNNKSDHHLHSQSSSATSTLSSQNHQPSQTTISPDAHEYGLCPGDPNRNRSVVLVKLTDTALRALENFYRTGGATTANNNKTASTDRPSIKLQLADSHGSITIGATTDSNGTDDSKRFKFSLKTIDDHGGSLECIRHPGRAARTAENLGRIQSKLTVLGTDDSYQKTRVKMAQANEEAKAHSVKVIKTMSDREPKGRQKSSKVIKGRVGAGGSNNSLAQIPSKPIGNGFHGRVGLGASGSSSVGGGGSSQSSLLAIGDGSGPRASSNWSPPTQGVRRSGNSIVPSGGGRDSRMSTPERSKTTVVPSINVSPPDRRPGVTTAAAPNDRYSSSVSNNPLNGGSRSVSPPNQRKTGGSTALASMPSFSLSPARTVTERRPANGGIQINGFQFSTGSNSNSPRPDSNGRRSAQLSLPSNGTSITSPPDRRPLSNGHGGSRSPMTNGSSDHHPRRSMPSSLLQNGHHHHGSQSGGSACSSTGTPSPPEKRPSMGNHHSRHDRERSHDHDHDGGSANKRARVSNHVAGGANGGSSSAVSGGGGSRDHFNDLMNSWASQRKSPVAPGSNGSSASSTSSTGSTSAGTAANNYVPHNNQPPLTSTTSVMVGSSKISNVHNSSSSNLYNNKPQRGDKDRELEPTNRDYTLDFGDIPDRKTRQAYKKTFAADYNEYKRLYDQLERVSARFITLGQELTSYQEGTAEYTRVFDKIINDYDSVKAKNSEYLRTKKRATYLHNKLAHIRGLIVKYDQTHPRASNKLSSK